jgi:hypothetical protein
MAVAEQSETPMLQHALDYLADGYPVFPVCSPLMGKHYHGHTLCTNPGKVPLVPWAPYQERLPTDPEVRVWWIRWPNANIGMATGLLSNVLVLDADGTEARKECLKRGGIEHTPTVWTGKIGGAHYHLAYPGGDVRNFARRMPGTDMRAQGGYVLLPPSVHASGNLYRWAEHTRTLPHAPVPDWLTELIHERGSDFGSSSEGEYREPMDAEAALGGFDQGERDDGLFRFACRMRHDDTPQAMAEALIVVAARACRPPFPDADAIAKVRYVYQKYEPGGVGPEVDADGWFAPEGVTAQPAADPPPAVFSRPISELLAQPDVEPDWMVDQLFTVGSNGWVAAEPKVGKSWVVLELAYALSTGSPFLGRFAIKQPRRVLYIQEEDTETRVKRRLVRLIAGDATRSAPSDEYFRYVIRLGFKLDSLPWLEALRQDIMAHKPEVVIMDVFNRLHGADENNQKEMTELLNRLIRLNTDYGCSFLLVHHNKKAQAGLDVRANQMIRGSGVLAGWAECSLYLRRAKEQHTIIVTPESKDAPEMDDFTITLADTEDGGMFLQVGEHEPEARMPKGDRDVIDAVERITARGEPATVRAVVAELGKDRSTIQARLKRLTQSGYLDGVPISDEPFATIIYTVRSQ